MQGISNERQLEVLWLSFVTQRSPDAEERSLALSPGHVRKLLVHLSHYTFEHTMGWKPLANYATFVREGVFKWDVRSHLAASVPCPAGPCLLWQQQVTMKCELCTHTRSLNQVWRKPNLLQLQLIACCSSAC
jgi:hypothetical protein